MTKKSIEEVLTDQLSTAIGKSIDTDAWTELVRVLNELDQIKITHGEDNTFSLPYYVKISKGLSWDNTQDHYKRVQWCHKQFGPLWDIDNIRGTWCYDTSGKFNFKTEGERLVFMLRWAQ